MIDSPQVLLRDKDGNLREVYSEWVPDLLNSGQYEPATEQDRAVYSEQKVKETEQETPLAYAKTVGEGVASGLTFGLSNELESAALGNAAEQKAREEAHPIVSFGSQAAGMVLPALIPVAGEAKIAGEAGEVAGDVARGTGIAGKATKAYEAGRTLLGLTPAGGSVAIERAIARGFENALPETTSFLGKIGRGAAIAGATQAVTGAEFGLGHVIHENALGDPAYTAEALLANPGKVASEVGEGALFGGVLGALIGGSGAALKSLAPGEGRAGAWLDDALKDFEAERNLKAAGGTQKDITAAKKRMSPESLKKIMLEGGDYGLVSALSSPAATLERSEALQEKAFSEMESILKTADAKVPPQSAYGLLARARTTIGKELADNPLSAGAARQFSDLMDAYSDKIGESVSLEGLHDLRKQISTGIKFNRTQNADAYFNNALHDFRSEISDEINSRLQAANESSDAWKAANRKYQVAKEFEGLANHGIARASGNNALSLTEGAGGAEAAVLAAEAGHTLMTSGLAGGAGAMATALVRRKFSSLAGAAARGLRGVLEPKAELLGALQHNNERLTSRIASDVRALLAHPGDVVSAPLRPATAGALSAEDEANKKAANLRQVANPSVLQERISALTQDWHEHAPNTSMAVAVTASKAVGYLTSKLPRPPAPTLAEAIAGKPTWKPSPQEIHDFDLHYNAILDPRSILASARVGRLTPQEVEAVSTVYPRVFKALQATALDEITKHKGAIPVRSLPSLELLLGTDLHGRGNNQDVYSAVQQSYAAKSAPPVKPVPKTSSKVGEGAIRRLSLRPDSKNAI